MSLFKVSFSFAMASCSLDVSSSSFLVFVYSKSSFVKKRYLSRNCGGGGFDEPFYQIDFHIFLRGDFQRPNSDLPVSVSLKEEIQRCHRHHRPFAQSKSTLSLPHTTGITVRLFSLRLICASTTSSSPPSEKSALKRILNHSSTVPPNLALFPSLASSLLTTVSFAGGAACVSCRRPSCRPLQ
jgi:hypothetical protein